MYYTLIDPQGCKWFSSGILSDSEDDDLPAEKRLDSNLRTLLIPLVDLFDKSVGMEVSTYT